MKRKSYYVDAKGQNKFVKKAFIDFKNQSRPTASLLIQNNNKDAGTFDVIIKDVYSPKGVRTVQVPTWSDKDGQDDIRWYEATRQANGDYKVSVKASDHKNSTGKYHIHLYYIQMMVLVWVSVQRLRKLNSEMLRQRHKQGSRMLILVLEPIR